VKVRKPALPSGSDEDLDEVAEKEEVAEDGEAEAPEDTAKLTVKLKAK
jgi:hypothetical protein